VGKRVKSTNVLLVLYGVMVLPSCSVSYRGHYYSDPTEGVNSVKCVSDGRLVGTLWAHWHFCVLISALGES
jgi:hypothetical protein